jgi:hypothetical protein
MIVKLGLIWGQMGKNNYKAMTIIYAINPIVVNDFEGDRYSQRTHT